MNQYGKTPKLRQQNLLDQYQEFLLTSRTPATVDVHVGKLHPLFRAWNDIPLEEWTRTRFVSWLSAKRTGTSPLEPRSINLLLTACKMFIAYCQSEDIDIPNFVKGIERVKAHRTKPVFYTPEEIAKLMEVTRGAWLEIVLALAFYAGMRRAEIGHATWKDIDWMQMEITVHGSKTHQDRVIPLYEPLREVLSRHQKESGKLI